MFYYDVSRQDTTNGTANTEDKLLALRTVANQRTAAIMGMYVSARFNSPGGLVARLKTAGTIGSGGSSVTPAPRDPDAPAASTTAFDKTFTAGTTLTIRQMVGCAAQGGFGGWYAATPEQAITLKPNGAADGNAEVYDLCGVGSTPFDFNLELAEF